jgi:Protein of unknown function (DUF2802)
MTLTTELLLAICAGTAVLTLTAVAVALRQSRTIARLRRESEELREFVQHVRREAHSAVTYGSDVGKRLRKQEQDLATLTDRVALVEQLGDARSFDRAIDVARQGAEADKLVANFGISRGEAELLSLVHGKRAATR